MKPLSKINFKQPKYILPAIVYFPLLFTGYFVIDMLHTEKAEINDPSLQSTEYLNPDLPQARVGGELEGKYESMLKSYGKIDDLTAISNIERDDPDAGTEEYQSNYSDADRDSVEAAARMREMEEQLRQSAERGAGLQDTESFPLTERERLIQSQARERQLQQELDQALSQIREQSEASVQGAANATTSASGTVTVNENAVRQPSETEDAQEVVKRVKQSSDYFHTLSENDPQPNLIKAIIDEDIKAVDGSRVRLRLLDDIEIGEVMMPRGSYIYATMNGFGSQRVKGTVKSLMLGDDIVKVSLSIYDTDGLEGLYVPGSSFRETAKDVASGAMTSNMSMNQGSYSNSLSQWGMQAVQNAYQRTTSALGKAVKKNSAKLKYGTFVYLVNGRETKND